MMKTIFYAKTRNVKSPVGNREDDSGIDFYIPENEEKFVCDLIKKNQTAFDEHAIIIKDNFIFLTPMARILIPSGIYVCIPDLDNNEYKISLDVDNKSGVATKKGLTVGADIIDRSYEGECHLSLFNSTAKTAVLEFGEKITQCIPRIVANNPIQEYEGTPEEMYKACGHESKRGSGGFGSTGTK